MMNEFLSLLNQNTDLILIALASAFMYGPTRDLINAIRNRYKGKHKQNEVKKQ